jgi:hypothetical protein
LIEIFEEGCDANVKKRCRIITKMRSLKQTIKETIQQRRRQFFK